MEQIYQRGLAAFILGQMRSGGGKQGVLKHVLIGDLQRVVHANATPELGQWASILGPLLTRVVHSLNHENRTELQFSSSVQFSS
jgi:hypothetical protein